MLFFGKVRTESNLATIRPPRRQFRIGLDSILILIVSVAFFLAYFNQERNPFKTHYACDICVIDGDVESLARDLLSNRVIDAALDRPVPALNFFLARQQGNAGSDIEILPSRGSSPVVPPPLRSTGPFASSSDPRAELRDQFQIEANPDTQRISVKIKFEVRVSPPHLFEILAAIVKAAEEEFGPKRVIIATPITFHTAPIPNVPYLVAAELSFFLFIAVSMRRCKTL